MYFIDVQGTLIDDVNKLPIAGAIEFIDYLNSSSTPYMIVTNNTKKISKVFLEYLNSIGLNIKKENYLDPLMLLADNLKSTKIAAYGSKEFLGVLNKMGYELDYIKPDSVLVATKEDFTSDEYSQMIEFLLGGASLVGMHETSIYAKNSKRYPGVGAILKMLNFATNVPYEVIGKPSLLFYKKANELINKLPCSKKMLKFGEIIIISDDVVGDLGGAKELGMKTIFVLSGKFKKAEEIIPKLDKKNIPDLILKDMAGVLKQI